MSRQFLTGLNLNKNELLNARIQNLANAPSSPVAGQIYYNTGDNTLRYWNGTAWLTLAQGGSVTDAINNAINALTTDDIEEGSSNLYYTAERAQDAVAAAIAAGTHQNITITYDDAANKLSFVAENGVADSTTDDLEEGTTNLYFTDQRAIDAVGGSATSANDPNTVVKRDGSGNFAAGNITANQVTVQNAGQIYEDSNLIIESNAGYPIQIVGNQNVELTSQNGDIVLSPDGSVHVNGSVIATGNLDSRVANIGGTNVQNTGELYVRKADDSVVFAVNTTDSIVDINGTLQVGPSYAAIELSADGSGNGVVYAPNNNLLLQSDNGNNGVYLGSVANENRVATLGGNQELTNKVLGSSTVLGADLDADGYKITGLGTPTNPGDAATKAYVDNATAGLTWKSAVNLLSATNVDISGEMAGVVMV
jgi:hypothetical protein